MEFDNSKTCFGKVKGWTSQIDNKSKNVVIYFMDVMFNYF